jgi:hypothetical protein
VFVLGAAMTIASATGSTLLSGEGLTGLVGGGIPVSQCCDCDCGCSCDFGS